MPNDTTLSALQEELKMYAPAPTPGQTSIERGGVIYGAQADERGPIGGGAGYVDVVTSGDFRVENVEELIAALAQAQAGQTVYVADEAEIDCSPLVHIDQLVFEIPGAVTLASGRGHNGSRGALIFSDTFATAPLFRAAGPEVRVSGLRLRGPNPHRHLEHHRRSFAEGRGHEYYYKFPISRGIETDHAKLRVDNCELAGWSHSAITLRCGSGHRVHHNFIHHNQYNGLGYGVSHDLSESLIEYNLFDFNRHSLAGTGRPGSGYEARHNVELGDSLSHCFDMHGGRDRKDDTEIAGTWMHVHHNTFRARQKPVVIRGVPEKEARIDHNWFLHHDEAEAVLSDGRTVVVDNFCGG